jgi:hypothetical protein
MGPFPVQGALTKKWDRPEGLIRKAERGIEKLQ